MFAIAMPEQSVFASYSDGETIPRVAVGSAATNGSGRYRLVIDPAVVPDDYITEDGQIDLDLRFVDATSEAIYSLSVGGTSSWANRTVPNVSIDLASGRVADAAFASADLAETANFAQTGIGVQTAARNSLENGIVVNVAARSASMDRSLDTLSGATGVIPMACGDYVVTTQYDIREYVHRVQGTTNLKVTAIAGSGRSETMGIAASATGSAGTFTMSGTSTVSLNSSTTWGPVSGSFLAGNTVSYKYLRNDCNASQRYRWKPASIQVFLNVSQTATRSSFAKCTTVPANWSYQKNQTTATTVSNGVTLAGVSLTAQSGWNTTSGLKFGPSTGSARICYSNSAGLDQSASIGANPA